MTRTYRCRPGQSGASRLRSRLPPRASAPGLTPGRWEWAVQSTHPRCRHTCGALARPAFARRHRNRNHRRTRLHRQPGAGGLVSAFSPRGCACPQKHDDPGALRQHAFCPARSHASWRQRAIRGRWIMSSRAIDQPKNGIRSSSRFEHKGQRCGHQRWQQQGLQRGLVFGQQNRRAGGALRQILQPGDAHLNAQNNALFKRPAGTKMQTNDKKDETTLQRSPEAESPGESP